jgi:hypothetical protein
MATRAILAVTCFPLALSLTPADYTKQNAGTALTLDEDDLIDLRRCRPGKCAVKLTDAEIAEVREVIAAAGADWKSAVQHAFRAIVPARAERYVAEGHAGSASYRVQERLDVGRLSLRIERQARQLSEALVARKQVYASHYLLASLSFMATSAAPDRLQRYLIYLNRSRSDVFDGLFAGFIRRTIARRLRAEAPQVFEGFRRRIKERVLQSVG